MKTLATIIVVLALVLGGGFLLFKYGNHRPSEGLTLAPAPNDPELKSNMQQAGLAQLSAEGTVMHIHEHLDLVINGQNYIVPSHIGIAASFISPIHTHDTTGVLHVESPEVKDFKLGQFFDEWGVAFTDTQVGDFKTDAAHKLIVAVNGSAISQVRDYVLKPHDEIEIWYGASVDHPSLIGSYNFPSGL